MIMHKKLKMCKLRLTSNINITAFLLTSCITDNNCYAFQFRPLAKTTSNFELPVLQSNQDGRKQRYDFNEYCTLAAAFLSQNKSNIEQLAEADPNVSFSTSDMCKYYINGIALLKRLGSKFGFYRNAGNAHVVHLDLSFPSIQQYAQKFIAYSARQQNNVAAVDHNDYSKPFNYQNLRNLLNYYSARIFQQNDRRHSNLTTDQINAFIRLCVADNDNRLFNLSQLSAEQKEQIIQNLREILSTSTGLQRILSLLTLSIINQDKDHSFSFGCTSISILPVSPQYPAACAARGLSELKLEVYLEFDELTSSTILHEITHCFHFMLMFDAVSFKLPFCNYSIMNSNNADFVQMFYPMLTEEKAKHIQATVSKYLNILRARPFFNDIILKMCCLLIKHGFGSVIFKNANETELDITHLVGNNNLVSEVIATFISVLRYHSNKKTWNTHWTEADEILTITGLFPLLSIGDDSFVIEDRQNELIYQMRLNAAPLISFKKNLLMDYYRRHCFAPNPRDRYADNDNNWRDELNQSFSTVFNFGQHVQLIKTLPVSEHAFTKPSNLLHVTLDTGQDPERVNNEELNQRVIGALTRQLNRTGIPGFDAEILQAVRTDTNCGDITVAAIRAQTALKNHDLPLFRSIVRGIDPQNIDDFLNSKIDDFWNSNRVKRELYYWILAPGWDFVREVVSVGPSLTAEKMVRVCIHNDPKTIIKILEDESVTPRLLTASVLGRIWGLAENNEPNDWQELKTFIHAYFGPYLCDPTRIDLQTKKEAFTAIECRPDSFFTSLQRHILAHQGNPQNGEAEELVRVLFSFYPFSY
ncbi:MAG: hypothetical protein LBD36_01700, partial [Holosporales bacterium]|nr:hypothetical protein [Holosporales bacterium]